MPRADTLPGPVASLPGGFPITLGPTRPRLLFLSCVAYREAAEASFFHPQKFRWQLTRFMCCFSDLSPP